MSGAFSQGADREMRTVWITTVSNLDWPKSSDRNNVPAQKSKLMALLDTLNRTNLNAVFLQVRTECDAFYQSDHEPWSRYLTGVQGTDPGYDPLAFAIEEAHNRGLELHAWLNPYRINASTPAGAGYFAENHVYNEHPEWTFEYSDGKKILNPGLPEVQQYIKEVVGDLLSKYDVDGIHFDDYFYSYSGTPTSLDESTYAQYGQEYDNIGDFRRGSINKMIKAVWDTIQAVRPHVRFGVSPFGIYGNGMNPEGVSGLDAYNTIYCDPLAWLSEGTVDYINPQLYWPTGGDQDFGKLLPWWAQWTDTYDRHVYAGHGIYKMSENPSVSRTLPIHEDKGYFEWGANSGNRSSATSADPWTLSEIALQIEIVRSNAASGALGGVFFRAEHLTRKIEGLKEYLRSGVYAQKSIVPAMTWKSQDEPLPPENLRFEKLAEQTFYSLVWDHQQDSLRYAVYQVPSAAASRTNGSGDSVLMGVTYLKHMQLDPNEFDTGSSIVVTTVNRYGYESAVSEVFSAPLPGVVTLVVPTDEESNLASDDVFKWNTTEYASTYEVTLATSPDLTANKVVLHTVDTFLLVNGLDLVGETTYYWSVTGQNIAGDGSPSAVRQFTTGFPAVPVLTSPEQDQTGVELSPAITYLASPATDSLQIQLSIGGSGFSLYSLVLDTTIRPGSEAFAPAVILAEYTTFYLRMRSRNTYGVSDWIQPVKFKTLMTLPEAPVIISPQNETVLPRTTTSIRFEWESVAKATSYLTQLARSVEFDELEEEQEISGTQTFTFATPELSATYFFRVAGKNVGGQGAWSAVIQVSVAPLPLGTGPENRQQLTLFPNPASEVFFLSYEYRGPATVRIADAYGRIVYSREISFQPGHTPGLLEIRLDVRGFRCTPCTVQVADEEKVISQKLIINKN